MNDGGTGGEGEEEERREKSSRDDLRVKLMYLDASNQIKDIQNIT